MKPWMLALASIRRELVTATYTSSQSVTIPFGVSRLETLVGEGADGAPADPGFLVYDKRFVSYYQKRDGSGVDVVDGGTVFGGGGEAPANYCDPVQATPDSTAYSSSQQCYEFTERITGAAPATTGASATGFGLTFPGGVGGPASPTPFANVTVSSGASYALTIPPGGFITITYYK